MQYKIRLQLSLIYVFTLLQLHVSSQIIEGFTEYVYKQADTVNLKLFVKNPIHFNANGKYPAIIFFFGGGWNSRKIEQFVPHSNYLSSKGMVAIIADYRVRNTNNTTPFDAVEDAKSAIRFLRENAVLLQIDTARIVASGGSAGGHLAAAAALVPGLNSPGDNLEISCKPNALVLYNPVFDNSQEGYGYERVKERYMEISPYHNIRKGAPPTIVFLGTDDRLIPVETAENYKKKMEEVGSRCDLRLYKDQKHGFFNYRPESNNDNKNYKTILSETEQFLISLGYIK